MIKHQLVFGIGSVALLLAGCGDDAPPASVSDDAGSFPPTCSVANGCGGCEPLSAKPGGACDATGAAWTCSGTSSVTCAQARQSPLDVTASRDVVEHVHVTWAAPSAAMPSGYAVRRDALEVAKLDASSRAFDDATVEADTSGAPIDLVATQGTRTDGVSLSWSVQAESHRPHAYEVVALYDTLQSAPAGPAIGERPAKDVRYEVSRDDGATWHAAGSVTTYLDVDAPLGSITPGTATTRADDWRNLTHLEVSGMPTATPPAPSLYRVRGQSSGGPTAASSRASGFRGVDRVSLQWQRSAGDADGSYADVPGLTGSVWFDDTAPLTGEGRFYRSMMTARGASSSATTVVRATRWGVKQVQGESGNIPCLLRIDGTVVCDDTSIPQNVVPGTFSELALSPSPYGSICLLAADGTFPCYSGPSTLTGHYKHVANGGYLSLCGIDLSDHVDCRFRFGGDPALPTAAESFTQLAATPEFVCGIRTDGKLRCWGNLSANNPLTAGPTAESYTALSVASFYGSSKHVCAIRDDRTLSCWGDSVSLGAWNGEYRAVATSEQGTCAVRYSDGGLVCKYGGYPSDLSSESFVDVSVARSSITGRRADGTLARWYFGARAFSSPRTDRFREVAIGESFSCGIHESGDLACWGVAAPDTAQATSGILHVAVVANSVCVVRTDHSLDCWYGPNPGTSPVPGAFDTVSGASDGNACAVRTDGKVLCWGNNASYQAPPGPSVDDFKAVAVGFHTSCGIRKDDTVACWGVSMGQTPAGVFREVALGESYGCGLRGDKRIVCWGATSVGPTQSTYEHLYTGKGEVMGLRADGALERVSAGGVAPWPDAFDAVAMSQQGGGCGLRRDGHLLCWGDEDIHRMKKPAP